MKIPIIVKEGTAVLIAESKGYNPNRAKDGKFTHGSNMSEEDMKKQFGTVDPYVYHLDYTKAPPIEFEEKGILPSTDGQFGKGVYMSNTKQGTQFNADLNEGRLYRVGKVDLIKEFGLYSSSKKGGVYKDTGLQFDDYDGQIYLEGKRSVPGKFLQVYDLGDWRDLKSWKIVKEMMTSDGLLITIAESKGYNPNRAKDGKFTFGKTSGQDIGNDNISDDELIAAYNSVDSIWEQDKQAAVMNAIAKKQGYDGKPKLMGTNKYDALSDSEFFKTYRGIRETDANGQTTEGDKLKKQFLKGAYRSGSGDFGSGIYMAESWSYANGYAEQLVNGEYTKPLLRIAVPKSAKLIQRDKAWDLTYKKLDSITKKYGTTGLGDTGTKGGVLYSIAKDPGILAALSGYDGIFVKHGSGENFINLSNRSIAIADRNYYEATSDDL